MEIFEGDVFTAFDAFKMRSLFQNDSVFPHFKSVVVVVMVVWTVERVCTHRFTRTHSFPETSSSVVVASPCLCVRLLLCSPTSHALNNL